MKRERIHLQGGVSVETGRDWNGRFYIGYSKGASVFVRCRNELKRFTALPSGSAAASSLESWLESLPATGDDD